MTPIKKRSRVFTKKRQARVAAGKGTTIDLKLAEFYYRALTANSRYGKMVETSMVSPYPDLSDKPTPADIRWACEGSMWYWKELILSILRRARRGNPIPPGRISVCFAV